MEWFPDWRGEVVAVVASGPSVTQEAVATLRGRCKVAVVNNNFRLAPWADLLYAADARWWDIYPDSKKFEGIKVTSDPQTAKVHKINFINLLGVDEEKDPSCRKINLEPKGLIGRGGNSAFHLINISVQAGSRKLIWVGTDFCGKHWHEDHPKPLIPSPQEKTLNRWRVWLDDQSEVLQRAGVSVVVASAISTLTAYPKVSTVEEALAVFGK